MKESFIDPYWGKNFFQFFSLLANRLCKLLQGKLSFSDLAFDEVQIIVLGSIAISCALIGTFLVLQRKAMLANCISHTILVGIIVAYIIISKRGLDFELKLSTMFLAALIAAFLTIGFTEIFTKFLKLQKDAGIGLVFTAFFALGIVLVTIMTKNLHLGTETVLGNADIIDLVDVKLSLIILVVNLFIFLFFFRGFQIITFDKGYAGLLGMSVVFFNCLLMVQTSITVVGAFRSIGVVLVLSFLVGPVLIAKIFLEDLKKILFWAPAIGLFSSILGIALGRHFLSTYLLPLSTGGLIACTMGGLYFIALLISQGRGVIKLKKFLKDEKTCNFR